MSYAAIVAALLHSILLIYTPAQLASVTAPTQAGGAPDTTALNSINEECPSGPEYDYTCEFHQKSGKTDASCMKNYPVSTDDPISMTAKCVGPGEAEGILYSRNGVWIDFSTSLPCTTNGDCAPGVDSTKPSYIEGQQLPSAFTLSGDRNWDQGIFVAPPPGKSGLVFNETTGAYEYPPSNQTTEWSIREYELPPSYGNAADGTPGPIPPEYEPGRPTPNVILIPEIVVPQAPDLPAQDEDNYYLGFNPQPPDTFFDQQVPSASPDANQGLLPTVGQDISGFMHDLLSGKW